MPELDATTFDHPDVADLLAISIREDLRQEGDVTSRVIPERAVCEAKVVYRQAGVAAGLPLAQRVLARARPAKSWPPSAWCSTSSSA